jgi:hypothetical protein
LVQDECGISCRACGAEAVTWADPIDADVPLDVLLRRERTKARRRFLVRTAAAVLIAGLGASAWFFMNRDDRAPSLRDPRTWSLAEARAAFTRGRLPSDLHLPGYYRDPELFLLERERSAQSGLVLWWNQRTREVKLDLLDLTIDAESPDLLPFVFEVSWFTAAQEQDLDVATQLLQALYSNAKFHVEPARFVCEHFASVTPLPAVQTNARRYVADLDERRNRLGR